MNRLLDKKPLPYPNVFDESGELAGAYRVTSLPTLVMVDAKGDIRLHQSRVISSEEVLALVSSLEQAKED